jgi:hypothetical protein
MDEYEYDSGEDLLYAVLGKDGTLRGIEEHVQWVREHRTFDELVAIITAEWPDASVYEHPSGEIVAELGVCVNADGIVRPIK